MNRKPTAIFGEFGRASLFRVDQKLCVHASPHFGFVYLCEGCDLEIFLDQKRQEITAGEGVFVPPWTRFSYGPNGSGHGPKCLSISFHSRWLQSVSSKNIDEVAGGEISEFEDQAPHSLKYKSFYDNVQLIVKWALDQNVEEVSLEDVTRTVRKSYDASPYRTHKSNLPLTTDFRIRRAFSYLLDNLGEEFRYSDIAKRSGISRPHFFKRFKQQSGLTPRLFYNALRLDKSYHLLTSQDIPLQHIALDLGFSAQSNFSRFFRQHQGIPPEQYRKVVQVVSNPVGPLY